MQAMKNSKVWDIQELGMTGFADAFIYGDEKSGFLACGSGWKVVAFSGKWVRRKLHVWRVMRYGQI